MKKILFNYAHNAFYTAQTFNAQSGLAVGNFDVAHQFRFHDIDGEFYKKNKFILDQPKGAGYWIWKYYFALKLLEDESVGEDDIIFYSDSGSHFISSIDPMVKVFKRDNLSVMTFLQLHKSTLFTKRDLFVLTGCDEPKYTNTCQRVGGWIMFKKDDFSLNFFDELLKYAVDYRIIADSPSQCGLPEYPDFFRHQHDESLISVIAKKYELYPYRNPSQHGMIDLRKSNNEYTQQSYERYMETPELWDIHEVGQGHAWDYKTFEQYPPVPSDTKSDYPTILELTRNRA